MLIRFRNWPILPKIMTISVISVAVMLVATFAYYIPLMEDRLMEGKQSGTRNAVEVAYGIVASFDRQADSGAMTHEAARAAAIAAIREIRYRDREYFWINDLTPRMIMHPTVPELDGKELGDYKDPNGKRLFVEFVKIAKTRGSGFVNYMWPKPGEQAPVTKISYVKLYEPWGWIVGSGIYLDDLQEDMRQLRRVSSAGALLFGIMTLTMAYLIGRGITLRLGKVIGGLREIASGKGDVDLTKRIAITSIDEIGLLSTEFNGLMESINNLTTFKKVIEEDDNIADVYARLWTVFTHDLALGDCIIYEIDMIHHRMLPVYPVGITEDSLPCEGEILDNAELCKARRTGHLISSAEFPAICRHFRKQDGSEHYCIPMSIGGGTVGIVQFVVPAAAGKAEREKLERRIFKAGQYIKESLPVIEAKRLMHTLRESALTDQLTGLHNRRFLQESVENLCAGAKRRGKLIGILMCDLDYFKQVNDTHGHAVGDKILQQTAHAIRSSVRESDLVIRFGGEEFLVVLMDIRQAESLLVAEKIRDQVYQTRFRIDGDQVLQKTISIGASEFPEDSDTFWQAIKYADVALYRSKDDGRNRCTRFTPSMWESGQF
jgi:diguanylate cyclase (GGDEF)-like protein